MQDNSASRPTPRQKSLPKSALRQHCRGPLTVPLLPISLPRRGRTKWRVNGKVELSLGMGHPPCSLLALGRRPREHSPAKRVSRSPVSFASHKLRACGLILARRSMDAGSASLSSCFGRSETSALPGSNEPRCFPNPAVCGFETDDNIVWIKNLAKCFEKTEVEHFRQIQALIRDRMGRLGFNYAVVRAGAHNAQNEHDGWEQWSSSPTYLSCTCDS